MCGWCYHFVKFCIKKSDTSFTRESRFLSFTWKRKGIITQFTKNIFAEPQRVGSPLCVSVPPLANEIAAVLWEWLPGQPQSLQPLSVQSLVEEVVGVALSW